MYSFKINSIETNDGTIIEPKRINIIVGPNSSGKSRFLKDIRDLMGDGNNGRILNNVVISSMSYDLPNNKYDLIESYNLSKRIRINNFGSVSFNNYYGSNYSLDMNSSYGNIITNNSISIGETWEDDIDRDIKSLNINTVLGITIPDEAVEVNRVSQELIEYNVNGVKYSSIIGQAGSPVDYDSSSERINAFIRKYGCLFYQYLGTEEKLLTCKRQRNFGLEGSEINFLSEVRSHIDDMKELSILTKKIFGKYVYLDKSSYGDSIVIRVSEDFDFYNNINIDNAGDEESLLKYPILDDEGDGIKNFVSTYLSLKGRNKNILLIDEPESFLHPPLARMFGSIIAQEVSNNQQIFIATHSEDIINGIFLSCPYTQINIIRIVRDGTKNIIRVMPDYFRKKIKVSPIFIMSNILKGLFSEKVYVTESFADSSLYQSLMAKYTGFDSYYFVNTEGKDKIGGVLELYDSVGINSVGIYDFDYFRSRDTVCNSLQKKLGNGPMYDSLNNVLKDARKYLSDKSRNYVSSNYNYLDDDDEKKAIEKMKDYYYHELGINSIDDNDLKEKLSDVIDELKKYGIYVLKCGCLEGTLKNIGYSFSKDKKSWIDGALSFIDELDKEELNKLDIIDLIKCDF